MSEQYVYPTLPPGYYWRISDTGVSLTVRVEIVEKFLTRDFPTPWIKRVNFRRVLSTFCDASLSEVHKQCLIMEEKFSMLGIHSGGDLSG